MSRHGKSPRSARLESTSVLVWLLVVALMMVLSALGVATHFGGWYTGLGSGAPFWGAAPASPDPELAAAARNRAVASAVALLIGLIGSVIGGWMASGEPMTFTYYRRRDQEARAPVASAPVEGVRQWR